MIKVNGHIIQQDTFGDGTLKCEAIAGMRIKDENEIWWLYDNDTELFALYSIVKDIQDRMYSAKNYLYLPYIPHARQDRNVSNRLFTLKYFSEIINSLDFQFVAVLDPHSDVSTALIDRVVLMGEYGLMSMALDPKTEAIMYPDAGAAKKYGMNYPNVIIGNKHRNADGRIDSYELMNFTEGTKRVIIRDDICSYGGTFVSAAKALKEHGVEGITLVVSHCENNILKGEAFDYIDKVITTDSICTISHPKLTFAIQYRTE